MLTFAQLAVAVALRPKSHGNGRNQLLLAAVTLNVVLALLAVSWTPLRELLRTSTLSWRDLVPALPAAMIAAAVARWQSRRSVAALSRGPARSSR